MFVSVSVVCKTEQVCGGRTPYVRSGAWFELGQDTG
jgi:hypothetical protein